jgi:hypothetical protein
VDEPGKEVIRFSRIENRFFGMLPEQVSGKWVIDEGELVFRIASSNESADHPIFEDRGSLWESDSSVDARFYLKFNTSNKVLWCKPTIQPEADSLPIERKNIVLTQPAGAIREFGGHSIVLVHGEGFTLRDDIAFYQALDPAPEEVPPQWPFAHVMPAGRPVYVVGQTTDTAEPWLLLRSPEFKVPPNGSRWHEAYPWVRGIDVEIDPNEIEELPTRTLVHNTIGISMVYPAEWEQSKRSVSTGTRRQRRQGRDTGVSFDNFIWFQDHTLSAGSQKRISDYLRWIETGANWGWPLLEYMGYGYERDTSADRSYEHGIGLTWIRMSEENSRSPRKEWFHLIKPSADAKYGFAVRASCPAGEMEREVETILASIRLHEPWARNVAEFDRLVEENS